MPNDMPSNIKSSKSMKAFDMVSMKSIKDNGNGSNLLNMSALNSSMKIMNKANENDINVIICQGNNAEL